ncbi:hypothetical protein PHYC_03304 [Phycisphaerales bacterium]|nr:hypothetical protein PHYC_03304 [Phycisphaerales bacterium]
MPNLDWSQLAGVGVLVVASLAGVVLTVLTLPGVWLTVLAAIGVRIWHPELVPWWVLIVLLVMAIVAELIEFGASAMGASKAGASRRGAIGAVVGSFVGAIGGTLIPPFPVGTILGGVVGAAAGTLIAERHSNRTWTDAGKAAGGAAAGRFVATLAKTAVAGIMGATASISAAFFAM